MTALHPAFSNTRPAAGSSWLLPLLLLSAAVIADNGSLVLPDFYRTPLSDLVYEDHPRWRAQPEEDNAWRKNHAEEQSGGRFKVQFLPRYDYSEREDNASRNTFMNENELARPKTNLFKYNF